MKPRPLRSGLACVFAAVIGVVTTAAGVRAERPEPVSERPERGRVAVEVVGRRFARSGTYYVGQDASLNDLLAKAATGLRRKFDGVSITREQEGKSLSFIVWSKELDLKFDFQNRDRVGFIVY